MASVFTLGKIVKLDVFSPRPCSYTTRITGYYKIAACVLNGKNGNICTLKPYLNAMYIIDDIGTSDMIDVPSIRVIPKKNFFYILDAKSSDNIMEVGYGHVVAVEEHDIVKPSDFD